MSYAKIAKQYQGLQGTRADKQYIINPSLFKVLGDLKNKKILDLACGGGYYSRIFKQKGASQVVGVDISRNMLQLAKQEEKKNPLGIEYYNYDVIKMRKLGEFDIVVGTFLLHYSKTKHELFKMCENIYKNLKKGGRFVSLNNSPEHPFKENLDCLEKTVRKEKKIDKLEEGDRMILSLYQENKEICSFKFYHWKMDTYNNILKKIGFKNIKWHHCVSIKKELIKVWKKNPVTRIIECNK